MEPVLAIVGPTATGKTTLALDLAERRPVEIVNADALQVYRGFDIGTAKPTAEARQRVPHHLVDILDADESFSAGAFAERARRVIGEIQARHRLAVVVGGSGLYLKALLEGIGTLPRSDPEIRRRLEERLERDGSEALWKELAAVDPTTAARLPPADRQRILRALEVYEMSGKPLSQWIAERPFGDRPVAAVKVGVTASRSVRSHRLARRAHARAWLGGGGRRPARALAGSGASRLSGDRLPAAGGASPAGSGARGGGRRDPHRDPALRQATAHMVPQRQRHRLVPGRPDGPSAGGGVAPARTADGRGRRAVRMRRCGTARRALPGALLLLLLPLLLVHLGCAGFGARPAGAPPAERVYLLHPAEGWSGEVGPERSLWLYEQYRDLVERGEEVEVYDQAVALLERDPGFAPARVLAAQVRYLGGRYSRISLESSSAIRATSPPRCCTDERRSSWAVPMRPPWPTPPSPIARG